MGEISRWLMTFLLNTFWQITAIAAIAILCARLLRRMPSRYAHTAWVFALAGCLVVPAATLVIQARNAGVTRAADAANSGSAFDDSLGRTARGLPVSFHSLSHSISLSVSPVLIRVLLWAYGLLLLFRVMRLAWVARQTSRIRQSAYARPMPSSLSRVAERCLRSFSLPPVPVLCSAEVSGPATVGIRRPVLILPESFFTDALSEGDVFSALCHEMAHIRRRDFFFNLLYEVVYVPVCFHPCAWLIMARIAQTRESACDEIAAGMLPSPGQYARSLLRIARSILFAESESSYALGLFDTNTLEERVMNILKTTKASTTWARTSRLLAACLVGTVSLGISAFSLRLSAASDSEDLARFAGTWETKYKGQAFFTLKLQAANGTLVGTCVHVTRVAVLVDGELIPGTDETTSDKILEVRASGQKLLLKIADGDSSSDGIQLEFTLTAKDQGEGIVFVRPSPDGPPPPKKPWHFQRVSGNP